MEEKASSLFMQISWIIPFLYWLPCGSKDLKEPWMLRPLKRLGVPFGPLLVRIKNGQDVVLEDGTKIIAKDFIPHKKGKLSL